jgi:hypothetical protein
VNVKAIRPGVQYNGNVITPEAIAKLAGQSCPVHDPSGNTIGTATMRADGTADVVLNQRGRQTLLVDGEVTFRPLVFDAGPPEPWPSDDSPAGGALVDWDALERAEKLFDGLGVFEVPADAPTVVDGNP